MYSFNYNIAGIQFYLEMNIRNQWLEKSHYISFPGERTKPDVLLRLSGISLSSLPVRPIEPQILVELSLLPGMQTSNINNPLLRSEEICERIRSGLTMKEMVRVDISESSVVISDFLQNERNIFFISQNENKISNNRLGPPLYAPFLLSFDAIIVHSAGLIIDDRAAVFMAHDEGGKTTVVRQATDNCDFILSDDQVILKQGEGVIYAHGTPWSLYTDGQKSARLGAFFLLEKADKFALSPLKPVESFEYIWNEHFSYWEILPKALRLKAFDLVFAICHQVPAYRMKFSKDYVDWNAIQEKLI